MNQKENPACITSYIPVVDDICASIQFSYDLSPIEFLMLNPTLNCNQSIPPGTDICVQGFVPIGGKLTNSLIESIMTSSGTSNAMLLPDLQVDTLDSTIPINPCKTLISIDPNMSCNVITSAFSVSIAQLVAWNTNFVCTNLQLGTPICVAADVVTTIETPAISFQQGINALSELPLIWSMCAVMFQTTASELCESIQSIYNLSPSEFTLINPSISCLDAIQVGSTVCVQGSVSFGGPLMNKKLITTMVDSYGIGSPAISSQFCPPKLLKAPSPSPDCQATIIVQGSETCDSIAQINQISVTQLAAWNLDLNCWDLKAGAQICVQNSNVQPTFGDAKIGMSSINPIVLDANLPQMDPNIEATQAIDQQEAVPLPTIEADVVEALPVPLPQEEQVGVAQVEPAPAPAPKEDPVPAPVPQAETANQTPPKGTPGKIQTGPFDPANDDGALASHNKDRRIYGMPDLVWNTTLATNAHTYAQILAAEKCSLTHSEGAARNGNQGENLANVASFPKKPTASMGQMTTQFINGPDELVPSTVGTYNHHTQLLWKTSTDVGCAIAPGQYTDDSKQDWFCNVMVCRYYPSGNVVPLLWSNPVL